MPAGVIGLPGFTHHHHYRKIEHPGPDKVYVALGRISPREGTCAVVAARVEFNRQSGLKNWTAYFGVAMDGSKPLDAAERVIGSGEPMSQSDGEHFFPRLPGSYYR